MRPVTLALLLSFSCSDEAVPFGGSLGGMAGAMNGSGGAVGTGGATGTGGSTGTGGISGTGGRTTTPGTGGAPCTAIARGIYRVHYTCSETNGNDAMWTVSDGFCMAAGTEIPYPTGDFTAVAARNDINHEIAGTAKCIAVHASNAGPGVDMDGYGTASITVLCTYDPGARQGHPQTIQCNFQLSPWTVARGP